MNTGSWRAGGEVEALVHPTAIIDSDAKVAPGVAVGPYSIIGPGVVVGRGTVLGPHVLVERDTTLGEQCQIAKGAVIGSDPQDLKYEGEPSQLVVGDRTVVREYATLNRGTRASGKTVVPYYRNSNGDNRRIGEPSKGRLSLVPQVPGHTGVHHRDACNCSRIRTVPYRARS